MKSALLTGATSGIGHEMALDLARRGWRLILPVRAVARAHDVATHMRSLGAPDPVVVECDLSDHAAVRSMCRTVAQDGPLDLVINNAGVGGGTDTSMRETNAAGVELRMAVNAITPHLIARELTPALVAGGRIVQVGSMGQAPLDLADPNFEHGYDGITAYCRSKVALVMSTIDLAADGVPVNVVHPANEMPTRMVQEGGFPIASTLDDGVLAVLRVALDSHLAGTAGVYFDRFAQSTPHEQALDSAARTQIVAWMDEQIAQTTR